MAAGALALVARRTIYWLELARRHDFIRPTCVLWRCFAYMARKERGAKFRIDWGASETHPVNATVFHRAVASGWIVQAGERRGVLAHGVIARWRDGALWLLNEVKQAAVWIYTSWLAVERVSPIIEGPYFRRTLEREHCGPRIVPRTDPRPWWARCDWEASGLRRAA